MRIVFGHDAEVGAWAADKLGISLNPPFVAMAIIDDANQIRGANVFNNWNGFDIEISHYGPGTWTRPMIRAALLEYPFDQVGALRLTARTKRSNKTMCKLFPRLGFVYEATLKRHYGPSRGDDAILYRLDREAAEKWR